MVEGRPLRLYFAGRSLFTNTDAPVFQSYLHIRNPQPFVNLVGSLGTCSLVLRGPPANAAPPPPAPSLAPVRCHPGVEPFEALGTLLSSRGIRPFRISDSTRGPPATIAHQKEFPRAIEHAVAPRRGVVAKASRPRTGRFLCHDERELGSEYCGC